MDHLPVGGKERRRIAKRAARKVSGEATLILSAGFALLMVVLFFFGPYTFIPLSDVLNVRPLIVWVALSFIGSGLWAVLHVRFWKSRIAHAQRMDAALKYQQQDRRRMEVERKMALQKEDAS